MKPEIHPNYHKVLYIDTATGDEWVTRSTVTSKETRDVDGEEIPVVRLEISSYSHPFWTGKLRELDADGKIDRFRRRFGGGTIDEHMEYLVSVKVVDRARPFEMWRRYSDFRRLHKAMCRSGH